MILNKNTLKEEDFIENLLSNLNFMPSLMLNSIGEEKENKESLKNDLNFIFNLSLLMALHEESNIALFEEKIKNLILIKDTEVFFKKMIGFFESNHYFNEFLKGNKNSKDIKILLDKLNLKNDTFDQLINLNNFKKLSLSSIKNINTVNIVLLAFENIMESQKSNLNKILIDLKTNNHVLSFMNSQDLIWNNVWNNKIQQEDAENIHTQLMNNDCFYLNEVEKHLIKKTKYNLNSLKHFSVIDLFKNKAEKNNLENEIKEIFSKMKNDEISIKKKSFFKVLENKENLIYFLKTCLEKELIKQEKQFNLNDWKNGDSYLVNLLKSNFIYIENIQQLFNIDIDMLSLLLREKIFFNKNKKVKNNRFSNFEIINKNTKEIIKFDSIQQIEEFYNNYIYKNKEIFEYEISNAFIINKQVIIKLLIKNFNFKNDLSIINTEYKNAKKLINNYSVLLFKGMFEYYFKQNLINYFFFGKEITDEELIEEIKNKNIIYSNNNLMAVRNTKNEYFYNQKNVSSFLIINDIFNYYYIRFNKLFKLFNA